MKKSPFAHTKSTAHSQRLALESRLVFDGAMVATVAEVQADSIDNKPVSDTTSATAAPSAPPVDFFMDKTPPAVDFQPAVDSKDTQPAFAVEPTQTVSPVSGVSGDYATALIVVDPRADNASALYSNPPVNTQVIVLDAARDGFQQVSELLQGRHDVTQLDVISWNDGNNQWLGNKTLSSVIDSNVSNELITWGDGFTDNANIVFHGANNQGSNWLNHIDALTGADTHWSQSTDIGFAQPHELIVVDTRIDNYQSLLASFDSTAEILIIDSSKDGIQQIVDGLNGRTDISALHILSHGSQGSFTLGTSTLSSDNINSYQSQLAAIGQSLTANGDILLYSCEVAEDASGAAFINQLANLTHADISASDDATGNAAKGGDWVLEYHSGAIETASLVATGYDGLLAAPVNTVPAAQSVAEDNSLTFGAGKVISIADADGVVSSVTVSVAHGTLTLSGIAGLTLTGNGTGVISITGGTITQINNALNGLIYNPTANYSGADTLTIATFDGATTDTDTVAITVTPNATAPVLTLPNTVQITQEDASSYLNFTAVNPIILTDADANDQQTLTLSVAHGTLLIKTNVAGGISTATNNGTGTVTLTGTAAQLSATLADAQGIRYTSTLNYNSSDPAFAATPETLSFTLSDGVIAHNKSGTTGINVTPVNDAPSFTGATPALAVEGGNVAFSLAQLASDANALDVDIQTGQQVISQLAIKIDSLPVGGTLTYKGGAVAIGSVVPVTDLANLVFTHDGTDISANQTISFNVTVSDGGGGSTAGSMSVTVQPKNVAPSMSGVPTFIEGQIKVVAPAINLGDAFDSLANSTITIDNIITGGQGTFFLDANNNNIIDAGEAISGTTTLDATQRANLSTQFKFSQNGNEPNIPATISPSYRITVTDAGGGTGIPSAAIAQTITLSIQPNNDDPTLLNTHSSAGTALTAQEGNVTAITAAMLKISDVDRNPADLTQTTPENQLVYTIETRPTQGEIQLFVGGGLGYGLDGWITLGDGGRFTQAQVAAGEVRYYQTTNVPDAVTTSDNFTFTVRDSAYGYDVWTDPANPVGNREGGLRTTPTGAIATQQFFLGITPLAASNTPRTDVDPVGGTGNWEGSPRPATSGFGGGNMVYSFVPTSGMLSNNSTAGGSWQEANVNSPPGYVITSTMLSYTITRTDTMGTPLDLTDDVSVTVPPNETVYTLTAQPSNGIIQRFASGSWQTVPTNAQFTQADINSGNIRFVHDGGEDHISSFGYTVSDGTPNNYTSTFGLDITPTNDRPTALGGLVKVNEKLLPTNDGLVRLGSSALGMSDVDLSLDVTKQATPEGKQDFLWFQVIAQPTDAGATQHGELQRWNGSAWVTVTLGEWLPSTLLTTMTDGATSGLRYAHDGSEPLAYPTNPNVTFQYQVRDDLLNPNNPFATDTSAVADPSGSAQSNQSVLATTTIQIIPVNNAPVIADKPSDADPTIIGTITGGGALTGVNNVLTNVPEGGTVTITSALLTAIDQDNTTVQRQYILTSLPTQGNLLLNNRFLGVGSTFTQDDIDNNRLTYRHNGAEFPTPTTDALGTYSDKFHFMVSDAVFYDTGANAPNYNTFLIDFGVTPNNDAPTITAPSGIIDIDSAIPANNLVTGFVVADPDLTNGVQAGETDFVQVTVRLLDSAGTPLTNYSTGFAGGGVSIGYTAQSGGLWAVTQTGTNSILQLQGSRAQVNAALAGLSVTFANDANTMYKVQVIVDDRLRDGAGALDAAGNDANGGELNQSVTLGGTPTAVPSTVYDWTTTVAVPAVPNGNIAAATVDIRASRVNETPTFTGPAAATVLEDVRTLIPASFVIADPESAAFNTPVTVTLSIPAGQGTLDIANLGTQSSFTPSGGQAIAISGDGTSSITLTGRAADIQALLNQRNFANTAADVNGGLYYSAPVNGNHDYNAASAGDVSLTLTFNDTGSVFGSDTGAGSVAANPANIVIPITITPVNDAPTVTNAGSAVPVAISGITAVTGFVISDPDNTDGGAVPADGALNITTGEVDFIQATIRLLPASGTVPLPATGGVGGVDHSNVVFSSSSLGGATVDTTYTGNGSALVIRGTMAQVNNYLSGLTVALSNGLTNNNATYRVQVIADDRLRDAAGVLNGSNAANGGLNSDGFTGTANVPVTAVDPYAAIPAGLTFNVAENTRAILSSGVNEAPSFVALDNTPTFVENGAAIVLDANATLTDPELSVYNNWNQAVLTLVRNTGANSDDVFGVTGSGSTGINFNGANIRNGATIIGTFTNSAGTLAITFNANATNAVVDSVLQAITYSNSNDTPPASITINYTINDSNTNTGSTPQGGANPTLALSGAGSITVGITPVNDTPALSGLTAKTYTEDAAPVVIGTGVTLDDPELKTFAGGTGQWGNAYVVLSRSGGANANDVFSASGTLSALTEGNTLLDGAVTIGTVTQNTAGTLIITFADGVTTAQAQAALRQIAYSNPIQSLAAAATSPITLNWVLHDGDTDADRALNGQGTGGDKSVTLAQTITLTGVNDAPVLSDTVLSMTQTEDAIAPVGVVGTLVSVLASTGNITDMDTTNPKGIAITATDSTHGTWYYSTNNGTNWTVFTATNTTARLLKADANTRVYFQPTANWQGTDITSGLTIRAWDGSTGANGGIAAQDLSIGANVGGTTAFSSATDVVAVTVTSVNDRPTASTDVVLPAILEDALTPNGTLISGLAFGYSDVTDNQTGNGGGDTSTAFSYIAIVGSTGYNAAQGSWQVSTTASPDPAVAGDWITIPVSGLSTSAALIFAADRQIRFVPAADFNGTPGTLQVRLADNNVNLAGTGKTSPNATTLFNLATVANGGTGTTDAWNSVNRNISTTVTAVSDAPSGAGSLVITNEDQTYTLTTANFGFSDPRDIPAETFSRVLITTLPASGTLKLNGANVAANTYILVADITAGKLVYTPATDYNNTLTTVTNTTTVSPALAIPDKTTVTSTLNISGATGNISDLNLGVNISHTGVDDLIITLTAPDGTVVTLFNRTGGGINANDLVVTFDDEATTSVTVIPNNGTTTTAGSYRPANPLTVFDGKSPNGTWTLTVTDVSNGDTGTLNSWSLTPTTVSTGLDFTFQVEDTGSTANGGVILDQSPNTMIINVIPLNDAPVLTATASNPSVTENPSTASGTSVDPVALFTGAGIADIDLSTTPALNSTVFGAGSITVSFTDTYIAGDVLFVNSVLPAGVSISATDTGIGKALTINLGTATTVAEVNSILAAISYKSTSDNPTIDNTDNARNYQIVVNDGNNSQGVPNAGGASALNSNIISGILTITPTNDAPVVDLNGAVAGTDNAVTWTEASNAPHTAIAINPTATVADTDNTNMTQLIMQVGGVQDGNNEVLNIGGVNFQLSTTVSNVAAGGFLVSYNSGTGTFTILPTPSSVALASSYQTLIQGITYINNTDNVTAGNRTVTFNITDAGFDNSTVVGGELGSNTPTTTINVVRANDQPVITNLNAVSYFENAINATAAIIDGSITLTDIDSPDYNGGSLTVSGLVAGQDSVSLPVGAAAVLNNVQINGGNIEYYNGSAWVVIGTHSGGAGANFVVSFNASATPAIVQRVIENLTFANSSNNPTLSRTLNLALNDGGTGTVQNATVGVTIKLDNDAPVMTAATLGGTYTEQNAAPLQFISGAISVSDPDSPLNFYINTAAVAGSLTVALDGYQTGDTLSVVHQGNGAGQIGVVGNTISYGGTAIATTSGGNGAPLVITFTSATATPTAVQALLAQLAFSNTTNDDPTVNNTDPSRVFTVTLNDGGNKKDAASTTTALTATLTGIINLTAVNDKPVITPAGTPAAYTENAVAVTVDNTVTVTDVDDTQMNGGTISITGNFLAGDVLAVTNTGNITASYNAGTGVLTLSGLDTLANYQAVLRSLTYLNSTDDPTDNTTKITRTLTYSLTDANSDAVGAATSLAATKTINVTPLQDAPVLTGGGATLAYTEQAAAAVIDATVTVSSDADDTLMSGATITLSAGYTAGDILSFTAQNGITISSNSAGVLVLTGNATLANYTAALRSITFNSTSDTPTIISASRTVTWQVRDANSDAAGVASSNTVTSTINITPVNDAPTLSGVGSAGYTENGAAVTLFAGIAIADVDDANMASANISIGGFISGDTLNFINQNGITGSYNSGTGILSLTGTATKAQYQTALQSITFSSSSEDPTVNATATSRTIHWTVTDANFNGVGAATSLDTTSSLTVIPAPDKPVMSAGGTLAYTENALATVIDATVSVVSDADDTQMASATVTIGSVVSGDTLAFTSQFGITGSYVAGTGVLSLSGTATLAQYQTVLRSVTYQSTSDDPTVNNTRPNRTVSWAITDANSDLAGAATSVAVTSTINLTAVNDLPVVAGLSPVAFTENGTAVVVGSTLNLTDPDDTQLTGATISITGNFTSGDILNFTNQLGITGSYAAGVLTLSGTTTLANYQAAMRTISFVTASDDPTVNGTAITRTLSWQVTDANSDAVGAANSAVVTNTITVTPLTDNPVVTTTVAALTYTEGDGVKAVDSNLTLSDVDDTQLTGASIVIGTGRLSSDELSVAGTAIGNVIAGTNITVVSYTAATGTLVLSGTDSIANYQSVLRTVSLQNPTDDPTNDTLNTSRVVTFTVTDANSDSAGVGTGSNIRNITVIPTQDAPVLTGGGTLTYTEQAPAAVIDATVTVSSDADDTLMSGATITLSAGYTAGDILSFTAQNGITISSNSAGVLVLTGNATLANYTAALRSITFNSTSDTPTIISASRTVTWQVRDANSDAAGVASSNTVTSTINILAINDTPVLTALGNTVNFTEVGTAVVLNNAVTVADVDLSPLSGGAGNYSGTTLTLMRNGGANAEDVFSSTGTLATLTQGGNLTVGGTTIGTVTTNSAGTLVLTFNTNATSALVNSALQQIAYRNNSTTPQASVQINWLFNDQNPNITGGGIAGSGQDQGGGGVLTASGSTTITIDRLPTAKADTNSIAENALNVTGNVITGATTADDQGDPATTVTGVATGTQASTSGSVNTPIAGSYGSLTLDNTGAYTYTLDNANPLVNKLLTGQTLTETYSYTITDADGDTSTTTLIITINGTTDGAPTVVPVDGNGAATGEATVFEQGLVTIPDTSETTTGTLTVTAPDGMASVTIGGTTFTVAQLAAFSVGSPSAGINTGEGTLKVTGFTIGTGAASAPTAGTLSYTYTLNATQAHTGGAAVTESVDTIALVVTDATTAANTSTGTLTVRIVDDTPTANNDTNSITENVATTTGNVFSAGSGGDVADRLGADVSATPITGVAAGTQASTSGNVGSAVAGSYGSLTLNATGGYTYTLDNSNAAVNALRTGQTLTETYSYTITDADGDTSTATLTITINGATDGAPAITPLDGNGGATGEAEVYEKGLVTVADTSETTTGTLTVSAPDGMASVTIDGITFTVAQLATFSVGSPSAGINTGEGTLKVTGFTVTSGTASAPTTGTLSYSYTLNAPQTHTGVAAVRENLDTIALIVTDATTAATQATGTLTVRIIDDKPTANADVNSIAEDTATTRGNVFSGSSTDIADRLGADVTATPVTAFSFGATSGTLGNPLNGNYGSLTLNADGSYTYTLDNTNPLVNKLLTGDTLLETYSYTITDADGDTSTTTLKITINGNTDNIPSIVPVDGNGNLITGVLTVQESGLTSGADTSETNTGTLTLSALDGLASINVGGTAVTLAQLNTLGTTPITIVTPKGTITLTGYNSTANVGGVSTSGTLSYTYTLTQVQNTPAATENTDNIALSITNAGGNTVTDTLIVQIIDDTPTANPDTNSVNEGNTTAATTTSGNVFAGGGGDLADRIGADVAVNPVTGVASGTQASTSGNVNSPVAGLYGSLTLNATGGYTYTLDNTNPAVNALLNGETLTETYSYTITDADGDTSTTTLKITINGFTDSTPEITPIDGNDTQTGQATVFEKGLVTPSDNSQTTTGTIAVATPDGMASVTIGGTTFTVAQLAAFNVGSPSAGINMGEGTLIVTGFNIIAGPNVAPTSGTLSYRYTLNAAQPQSGGSVATESTDRITLVVTDNSSLGNTATSTLIVRIVDDTPTAKADTNSVIEGTTPAATTTQGNVFGTIGASAGDAADRIGADTTATPVTGVSFAGSVKTVGVPFNSAYGSLRLNADGTYLYALDNTNATVNALGLGQTLSETFSYTITDADGDTSTTTLTITINGRNDAPIAVNDIQVGISGQPVIINVLGNDLDPENDTNPATVRIVGTAKAGDSLEVAGEGIWSVNPLTGAITFTPFAGFTADPTPIRYTVTDRAGLTSNPATVTVDYPQNPPLAVDNTVTGVTGKPITITVLDNDSDPENDINPATLHIVGTANAGDSLVVAGQGTWLVDGNTGTITFTPDLGFTGSPTPISYTVSDNTGLMSNAARVTVNYPSVIATDTGTSGSLIMLSNPDKTDSSSKYNEEEKKGTFENKFKPDNQLPPAHLSLYVPIRHHVISLTGSLRDQVVLELERYSFSVPRWMFRHTDPNEQLEFEAARPDGSSLPEWLSFNPKTLKFSGVPPKGAHDERVMVIARDTYGNEVHATFNVHVNRERMRAGVHHKLLDKHKLGEKRTVGKAGLSEQIHAMGKLSKLQESRALLDGFKSAVSLADK